MATFKPLSPERARQIRQAMERSRSVSEGVAFEPDGKFAGTAPVSSSPDDRRNVIGKYDTHYGR